MCHIWKNASQLEQWVTVRKMRDIEKNVSQLGKFVEGTKMRYSYNKCVIVEKMCRFN